MRIFHLHCTNNLAIKIKELSFIHGKRPLYKNEGGRQADGKRRQRNLYTEDVTVSSKCEKNIYIFPGD